MIRQHGVFLLITRDDGLDALLKVRLGDGLAAVAHGTQRALVDDVGKLCAGSTRRHTRDGVEVHIVAHTDFARMHAQDGLSALQVRQLDRHTAVKAARTRQRRIERLGAVRRGEDHHAVVALEAVHLGQQLVQGLLPLVVSAELTVALFADGVDLIDEHDARGLFLGLTEQIAHL